MHSRYSEIDVRPRLADSVPSAYELRLDPSERARRGECSREKRRDTSNQRLSSIVCITCTISWAGKLAEPSDTAAVHRFHSQLTGRLNGCSERVRGRVVGESSVERRCYRACYTSYPSVWCPWCRGDRSGRSTGTLRRHARSYLSVLRSGWVKGYGHLRTLLVQSGQNPYTRYHRLQGC